VALYAVSDRLIWHSTEVKPYGTDAFVAVLLTWLAVGPVAGMTARRRLALLALAATAAVWLSYPSVFVFAALSLGLLPDVLRERGAAAGPGGRAGWLRGAATYAAANLPVAISFLIVLRLIVRVQQSDALTQYWD